MTALSNPTLEAWLTEARRNLQNVGIQSARLDADLLAAWVMDCPRTWLHAHPEYQLLPAEHKKLNRALHQRQTHEPLAYITGRKEFYGRSFNVTSDTLVPRPESEAFIDIIKRLPPHLHCIDIGTGSGVLAISTALEQPSWSVIATDSSPSALKVAQKNATVLRAQNLVFKVQNLLQGDLHNYDVLLANLPYVPQKLSTKPDLAHEPPEALFAGVDGLEIYRQLVIQLATRNVVPKHLLLESLQSQHDELSALLQPLGYHFVDTRGLVQYFQTN